MILHHIAQYMVCNVQSQLVQQELQLYLTNFSYLAENRHHDSVYQVLHAIWSSFGYGFPTSIHIQVS